MSKTVKTDLKRLDALQDKDIDYSDSPEITKEFWADAEVAAAPVKKVQVSIRLSPDVLEWFKKAGPGYQSRINSVLENYVTYQEKR